MIDTDGGGGIDFTMSETQNQTCLTFTENVKID